MFDWTTILTTVIATIASGGWIVSRRKRRQEEQTHLADIEAKKAEITAALRESETKYTREALDIYTTQVIQPLRDEIKRLSENQIRFQAAINAAPSCRHYPDCAVMRKLHADAESHGAQG